MPVIAPRRGIAAGRRDAAGVALLERPLTVVAALTLLALAWRLATLGARGFWIDEAITIDLIHGDLGHVADRLDRYTLDQPPLYYLLAWGFAKALGTGEFGLRLLPALCGALTVPVAYLAGAELFTRRAGYAAALLTALSPLVVWHSQDARPYALVILLGGLSFLLFLRLLHGGRWWTAAGWALVSALAMTAHYAAGFLVAGEVAWLLWALLGTRQRVAVAAVLAGLAAVGLAVAVLGAHRSEGGALSDGRWTQSYPVGSRLAQVAPQLVVGYQPPLQVPVAVAGCLLAAALLALIATRGDSRERRAALVAAWVSAAGILVPMALAADGRLGGLTTRYLVGAWVPLACAAGGAVTLRRARRAGPALLAALCVLFVAVGAASAWRPKFDRDDWRAAARALGAPAEARAIVLSPNLGGPPFRLYRPAARQLPEAGARVREVALVGLPKPYRSVGETPRPPRRAPAQPPAPGFTRTGELRGDLYTIFLYRSDRPRTVRPAALARSGLGGEAATVLLELPAGR
jgi:4-amino-4-deoxy-L-arabinose transferase-like glycosyltransferase